MSPDGPGCEPGLPPASAGEWRGRCPQVTWAWGGGSGLGNWERGQLSAQGAIQGHGQSQALQPKPRPRSVPTRAGKAGGQGGRIRREWVGSRQVRRRSEAERADEEAAPGSQRGQRLWLQLPRASGPSDVLNPDWAGVPGWAGSLGGARAGSSLGTSHLLPDGPMAPRAPRSYKG